MDLKTAAQIAKSAADPKGGERGYDLVQLRDGVVEVNAGSSGVVLTGVDDAGIVAAVDAAVFLDVVKAVSQPVSMRTTAKKLVVGEKKAEFQIAVREPPPAVPLPGEAPAVDISEAAVRALTHFPKLLARAPSRNLAVRLTPHWCGATTGNTVSIVWAAGAPQPVTLAPDAVHDLKGAVRAQVVDGLWWATMPGVHRWSRSLVADWPDDSVNQLVQTTRSSAEPWAHVHPTALRELAERAGRVLASPIDPVRITVADGMLTVRGGGTHEFSGEAQLLGGDGRWTGGLPWSALAQHAEMLEAIGVEVAYLRCTGARMPIVLYCTDPLPVEILMMPAYLG